MPGASEAASKREGGDHSVLQAGGLGLLPAVLAGRRQKGQGHRGPERQRPRDKGGETQSRQKESRDSEKQRHHHREGYVERWKKTRAGQSHGDHSDRQLAGSTDSQTGLTPAEGEGVPENRRKLQGNDGDRDGWTRQEEISLRQEAVLRQIIKEERTGNAGGWSRQR